MTQTTTTGSTQGLMNILDKTLKKYRALYPEAEISKWFLFNATRNELEEKPCATCTGLPCKKTSGKHFRQQITVECGELNIRKRLCKYFTVAQRQRKATRLFENAKIPQMYVGKTFKDYDVTAGNKNAIAWAKDGHNLYLYGAPGTGKTFLAAIVAQNFLQQGASVIFGDVPSLLDSLKSTFDTENVTLENLMTQLSEVDVLVLDDLGTETATEWAVERLYLIINRRYNAGKKLIITSNYPPEITARRLDNPKNAHVGITGSRIVSRIMGMCKIVMIRGEDRRLKGSLKTE